MAASGSRNDWFEVIKRHASFLSNNLMSFVDFQLFSYSI